ncbi:MAG: WbuC family cupin fold metalloprotein [Candidatus Eisenbacteria bacterium]|uniref:WbuC family cupin fold metalloprotein n=1 Tax=Eiseniibacteriota bacterium TaxID=2212470 RepID=A0A937X952_UNCEI|nr:WbuC family cupin fold metalloprotein [Candidatus Eisenbacteria bacterium]
MTASGPGFPDGSTPFAGRPATAYVTRELLARLCERAARLPRGRTNHDFHDAGDGYQRLLNAAQPGSYIRPHRHRDPGKSESFVVLQGEIAFFRFDDDGGVLEARRLGPSRPALAVDLAPGVWHCFLALAPDTVVFEGKNGPYDPATDKEFPAWAPAEGDASAAAYMETLLALAR